MLRDTRGSSRPAATPRGGAAQTTVAVRTDSESGVEPAGDSTAPLPAVAPDFDAPGTEAPGAISPVRTAVAVGVSVMGAAVMVGGIFIGISPRPYAAVAGILGLALAVVAHRIRRPGQANAVIVAGMFAIGLLMVVPTGLSNVIDLRKLVASASASGSLLRPPVPFVVGWRAIVGWLMGIVGFATAWTAIALRRPLLAVLLPLPFAALVAFSVPSAQQLASGIALVVAFVVSLVLVGFAQESSDTTSASVSYQARKAARALPIIGALVVGLYFLSRANFLFPPPVINPEQEPQKPKTVPLSAVEDRVLFEVDSTLRGPWRIGSLDVYDGHDWRLPAFAQSTVKPVPKSGIVDSDLTSRVKATFTVRGLGGAVLPALPNTTGIRARGPALAYDARNGNIRLVEGEVQPGLAYDVFAPGLPSVSDLRKITDPIPDDVKQFTSIPPAPPAVEALIRAATHKDLWDEFDHLRTYVLDNVTAAGPGIPKSVTPQRVEDMVAGSRRGSPFEIVAAQAMLARWIGLPSRIGYGFDGGDLVDGKLAVRPRHGATFVEVYFPGYKWLPVIGAPKKAEATTSSDQQQVNPNVLPSQDIAVQLTLPVLTARPSVFGKQVQRVLAIVVPTGLLALLAYVLYPVVRKSRRRSRRRAEAREQGPVARIALAYAEWRDTCTDFACGHATDTPLMFLKRFPPDEEHRELAWLVTRVLWGDLQHTVDPDWAHTAEELSRSLRRRLSLARPITLRAIAASSRLSLRDPYGAEPGTEEVAVAS